MRTTLLGSLLDVAARNLARGREAVALFEAGARLPARHAADRGRPAGGRLPRRHAGAGRPSRIATARSRSGRWCRTPGAAAASRSTFSRSRACSRRSPSGLGCPPLAFEPTASRSCTRAAAPRSRSTASTLGWLGEVHPLVCRTWDIAAAVGFEIDAAPLLAAATARRRGLRGRHHLPGGRGATSPSSSPPTTSAADVSRRGARRRRRAAARASRSSTSTRASSSARARRAWRWRSSSAPPTARSPTRRSRPRAPRSSAELEKIGGTLRE